mmetsp:Transcript_29831/g.65036  ORF Transcript_29831/g.65036 Transcript_29831/m.65036 type:complete len:309 (+) Transcript_29831:680-1606(+)
MRLKQDLDVRSAAQEAYDVERSPAPLVVDIKACSPVQKATDAGSRLRRCCRVPEACREERCFPRLVGCIHTGTMVEEDLDGAPSGCRPRGEMQGSVPICIRGERVCGELQESLASPCPPAFIPNEHSRQHEGRHPGLDHDLMHRGFGGTVHRGTLSNEFSHDLCVALKGSEAERAPSVLSHVVGVAKSQAQEPFGEVLLKVTMMIYMGSHPVEEAGIAPGPLPAGGLQVILENFRFQLLQYDAVGFHLEFALVRWRKEPLERQKFEHDLVLHECDADLLLAGGGESGNPGLGAAPTAVTPSGPVAELL